ncbi:unnamed protein product [Zymoseptoria tritici ST99CH_1E4]|uniref:CTLH domain-containing protein n=1 Tax=Zymoseptoria tritici ST99CH_1E4 TaxID=1276532 RepID=A0A2H1GUH0_ZYMTR|nr:unnamed protein product [Zymoseptoria tritici ST99CH_1E4]
MRPDHTDEHNQRIQQRPGTNGASQNGSSPHTNGSVKSETNGHHTNGNGEEAVRVRNKEPFFGHDREEVTRIVLQSLSDMGFRGAAEQLSRESGYELEIPSVAAFRNAVLDGNWEDAESLLFGMEPIELDEGGVSLGNGHSNPSSYRKSSGDRLSFGSQNGSSRHGLPLAEGADTTLLRFHLRQQKYLELLERRDLTLALSVLRNELTPLKTDVGRLHFLSSLVMCPTIADLRRQADWDGVSGSSRTVLLSEISKYISPSVMIPEHRLATLLTNVQEEQIRNCRYHNTTVPPSLYTPHDCSADDFPLHTLLELSHHTDEVWHLEFSHDGALLATAGRDGLVCVYDTIRWRLKHEFREHERNHRHPPSSVTSSIPHASSTDDRGVCFIAFSPDDTHLISCSKTNDFVIVNVITGQRVALVDDFDYPISTAAWLPDSRYFVIGSQSSQKPLGLYSLANCTSARPSNSRTPELHSWREPPWRSQSSDSSPGTFRITDCSVNTEGSRMAATTLDNRILLFSLEERDAYKKLADWKMEDKLTSINFSRDGEVLLVNMNEGRVLALNSETGEEMKRYEGMVQKGFVIRSGFGGAGEGCVVSGSEDSKVLIWRRSTGAPVAALDAHAPGAVNAVAWHPRDERVFASAGDDRRVRIWTSAAAIRANEGSGNGLDRWNDNGVFMSGRNGNGNGARSSGLEGRGSRSFAFGAK